MKGMHGIIFSYDKENGLRELIENRVHGSIPFGGDYRIIDFILSSMVNAGVTDVGVIMHGKCQSMMDHLRAGKSWDLSRNHGGLTLLPAFAYRERGGGASGRSTSSYPTAPSWRTSRCGTCCTRTSRRARTSPPSARRSRAMRTTPIFSSTRPGASRTRRRICARPRAIAA